MSQELKTATVAACSGVVGRALVKQLLNGGTRVAGFVRAGSEREVRDLVEANEGRFSVFSGDLTDPKSCAKLIATATEALGASPTAHFHAAGSFEWVTWTDVSKEAVEKLWSSNYTTAWAMGREIFKVMQQNGGGSLVFVSNKDTITMAGKGMGPYLAPKAALNMLVHSMAAEGAPHGIRVNAVLPGIIDTEVNRQAMPDQDPGNWVSPARLAGLMIDLAQPKSDDVSGALLTVRGKLF